MKFQEFFYNLKLTNELKKRDIVGIICIVTTLALSILQMCQIRNVKRYSTIILVSQIFLCFNVIYLNYWVLENKKDAVGSKLKNQELEIKNVSLTEITDNVRCFKHDFNNIIQAIDGFISVKDMNSLATYLEPLFNECQRLNSMDVLNGKIAENPAICSILISKLRIAERKNIKMNIEILTNLSTLKEKSYLISRMLGIMIDNALEASESCTNQREINIQFLSIENNTKNVITIENTYEGKDIDTKKIFEKDYTTKKGNTGLGLWKVQDILSKDSCFELITSKDDNLFKQKLEIISCQKN